MESALGRSNEGIEYHIRISFRQLCPLETAVIILLFSAKSNYSGCFASKPFGRANTLV
jgi:hypothetical protein